MHTMTQYIEKYVEEFNARWNGAGLDHVDTGCQCAPFSEKGCECISTREKYTDWLRTTLTKVAEEARREERERIVAWANEQNEALIVPDFRDAMYSERSAGECDGYKMALSDIVAHLTA